MGEGLNVLKLRWLNARMDEANYARVSPALSHSIQVWLEAVEVDMDVGVDQLHGVRIRTLRLEP
jgi:hypothetical protein